MSRAAARRRGREIDVLYARDDIYGESRSYLRIRDGARGGGTRESRVIQKCFLVFLN